VRLDDFAEVDVRLVVRLAPLRVPPDVFRADVFRADVFRADVFRADVFGADVFRADGFREEDPRPRVPVLFEVVRARPPLVFLDVVPPARLEPDRAVDFRRVVAPDFFFAAARCRRASAPTPAAPAAPAATRSGRFLTARAAPEAARAAPLITFWVLVFFLLNISTSRFVDPCLCMPSGRRS
jgi:hypothetical protein